MVCVFFFFKVKITSHKWLHSEGPRGLRGLTVTLFVGLRSIGCRLRSRQA